MCVPGKCVIEELKTSPEVDLQGDQETQQEGDVSPSVSRRAGMVGLPFVGQRREPETNDCKT